MTRDEVLAVLRDKAVHRLEVEPGQLVEDASFVADLHADSLALVELVMDLEDELGIDLPEEQPTVGRLADAVERALAARR